MSSAYMDCEICGIGFDFQNTYALWCDVCGCQIGSCCKENYMDCLEDPSKEGGEMAEDKCPFCNKQVPVDYFLLHYALKKLSMSKAELFTEYQKLG